MRLLLLLSLLVNLFLLSSCKKYKPANSSFFIKSDVISVSTTPASQGSGSNKITDLWLYVNGKYQGTYPVGSLMPIANKDANATINIFAGIKNNGIADTRIFYPFYQFLTLDTFVTAGKTFIRPFTFKYKSITVFDWLEDFNTAAGYSVKASSSQDAVLTKTPPGDDTFEGIASLAITLSGTSVHALALSTGSGFALETGSSDVYLELNYKSNVAFTVGLKSLDETQSAAALVVNPQANWNKIYIQLSTAVSTVIANRYKVYFEFIKNASDPTKQVFLDNIKLVHIPQ